MITAVVVVVVDVVVVVVVVVVVIVLPLVVVGTVVVVIVGVVVVLIEVVLDVVLVDVAVVDVMLVDVLTILTPLHFFGHTVFAESCSRGQSGQGRQTKSMLQYRSAPQARCSPVGHSLSVREFAGVVGT